MSTSYPKQRELGLSGLALLRNWLVGDEKVTKTILDEIRSLANISKHDSSPVSVDKYSISDGYSAWADTYDDYPNLLLEVEEPVVKSILRKFTPGKALDAGCGTGRYSEFLFSLGHSVVGVDQSSAMLNKAKPRVSQVKFIQAQLNDLPLDNKSFDLAICALALTHFQTLDDVLSELTRVVQPGGLLVLSDIHPWIVALGGQAEFQDKDGKKGYVTNYIHWHCHYLKLFKRLGLKVQECKEPEIGTKHLKLAQSGSSLSPETNEAALKGLPLTLIWVLERS